MGSENKAVPSGGAITIILGTIVILVAGVWLLAKLATSGFSIDASVMSKEAIASRIKPVGESKASEGGAPGSRTGEGVYKAICASCHNDGLAGAPKFADTGAWSARLAQGYDTLVKHAIEGIRGMPAKGGATDLTNEEVARAVAYMGNAAGAKFTEPAVAGAEGGGAAAAIDPNVKGKEIYASVCMACHDTGAAGAPKFGDKAAWAPRVSKGLDALVASGIKGLNAMPAKGGYSGSDEEFRAAVEYMVNASK
ncbi:c-type cytochrome [Aquaspirillum serpens]|uniref:c-type cytochrome n=1 Tax=Aquaspirillum serpens TaxID=190 RepID=UPI0003B640ED|nr:c-type cytochrome [Aquaspirillum serpens]